MEKKTFENLTTEIVGEQIKFVELENQQAVKWYDKKYIEFSHFAPSKKYGVILDGIVYFDFTAPIEKINDLMAEYKKENGGK